MGEIDWARVREESLGETSLDVMPATIELPALPHAVTLYLQKSQRPGVPIKELAEILETDTGLTLELYKYVNSAFVGLRHKATSVQQALSLLGQRKSRMFVTTTGMQAAVRARKSKLINQACFWNASLQKALFAREVAGLLKADRELAFAGALLQDYLLPVLTTDLFADYLPFVESRVEHPASLVNYERKRIGFDHASAAACLALRWHLPDELVVCLFHHHDGLKILTHPELGRTAVAAVALSAMLPDQLRQQYDGLEHLFRLQEKWPAFNVVALAEKVDAEHERTGLGVRNDFPLSRRCKPVTDTDGDFSDGTLKLAAAT